MGDRIRRWTLESFSERYGYAIPRASLWQFESMGAPLRNALWRSLQMHYWDHGHEIRSGRWATTKPMAALLRDIWILRFRYPVDNIPSAWGDALRVVRQSFYDYQWHDVYDFVQFVPAYWRDPNTARSGGVRNSQFRAHCNAALEREGSADRFVGDWITPLTGPEEISDVESAARLTGVDSPAAVHIRQSLSHLSNREHPDYRNSIKEAISAVEATCERITGKPDASLGDALKHLGLDQLHAALRQAFDCLYGWTSNADGIRHVLSGDDTVEIEDARIMLVACSAFINYLVSKSPVVAGA